MLKKYKSKIIIAIFAIVGILLILLGSIGFKDSKTNNSFSVSSYTNEIEKKLESFLKNVDGIDRVDVIVTLDISNEKVYAKNEGAYEYIFSSNGDPISIAEIYPYVRGVGVACTNGQNDYVKKELTELISSYLGISTNRIKIVPIG
jgi:hypothetical protein